jgi:hypothetical protein
MGQFEPEINNPPINLVVQILIVSAFSDQPGDCPSNAHLTELASLLMAKFEVTASGRSVCGPHPQQI